MPRPTPDWRMPNTLQASKWENLDSIRIDIIPSLLAGACLGSWICCGFDIITVDYFPDGRLDLIEFSWPVDPANPYIVAATCGYSGDRLVQVDLIWRDDTLESGPVFFNPRRWTAQYEGDRIISASWADV